MIPGGAQPGAFGKALAERGIDPKKTEGPGTGAKSPDEHALASMVTSRSASSRRPTTTTILTSPMNKEFVKAYNEELAATRISSRSAVMTART